MYGRAMRAPKLVEINERSNILAKKEAKTDLWVYDLLKNAGISAEPQGSSIKEIEDALKTASKKGTGKIGRPEFVAVVKD